MPSLPRTPKGTQTTPPPTLPRKKDQGIDTQELEESVRRENRISRAMDTRDLQKGIKGLNVATQTGLNVAGKEERGWAMVEAGTGDTNTTRDNIGRPFGCRIPGQGNGNKFGCPNMRRRTGEERGCCNDHRTGVNWRPGSGGDA